MIKSQRALGSKVPQNVTVLLLRLPRPLQSGPAPPAQLHPDSAPDVSAGHAPSTPSYQGLRLPPAGKVLGPRRK